MSYICNDDGSVATRVYRVADEPGLRPGRVWGAIKPPEPGEPFMRIYDFVDTAWMDCPVVFLNAEDFDRTEAISAERRQQERGSG